MSRASRRSLSTYRNRPPSHQVSRTSFPFWGQCSALCQEAHTTFFLTHTHLMDICSLLFPFLKVKDMVLLVFLPWRGKSVALYSRYIPISFFHLVYFNGSSPHALVLFSLFVLFLFSICFFTIIHVSSCNRSCLLMKRHGGGGLFFS